MSQEELRDIYTCYIHNNPIALTVLAKSIGIAWRTLRNFLDGEDVRVDVWVKLEEYADNVRED